MATFAKLLLLPALALCAFVFFLFLIGSGTAGKQSDAWKGLFFGLTGLAACGYSAYRIYFGPGLSKLEWLALPVALFPIVMIFVLAVRK